MPARPVQHLQLQRLEWTSGNFIIIDGDFIGKIAFLKIRPGEGFQCQRDSEQGVDARLTCCDRHDLLAGIKAILLALANH